MQLFCVRTAILLIPACPQIPTPLELSPLDPPLPHLSRAAHRLSPRILVGSRLEDVVEGERSLSCNSACRTYAVIYYTVVNASSWAHC